MLQGTKSISLSYYSMVDGEIAVYMTAKIPDTQKSTSTKTIQNQELYEANKEECRADIDAFNQILFQLEDEGIAGTTSSETNGTTESEDVL